MNTEPLASANTEKRFHKHVAVITGASGGIGKAIALALADQGAALCLVGRNPNRLEAVVENARTRTAPVVACRADLTIADGIQELTDTVRSVFGAVDILIHSAGVISIGPVESAPVEDLDWQYRVNVRAPYQLTQALLPMLKERRGQIVFLNSLVGLTAKGGSSQYSVSKQALKALADSLRQEVNPEGLRVLSVFLGRAASSMQAAVHRMENRSYQPELMVQPDDVASTILNALSLSRTAEITDVSIRHAIKSV
jgi:short-subunit dehydrogenase